MKSISSKKGDALIFLMIVVFLFTLIMTPVARYVALELRVARATIQSEQALQLAEAGINYYQWHLAHYPSDYKDGTAGNGPYVHSYTDFDTASTTGYYSLVITPPVSSSTIVTIQSTGWTSANPAIKRTVTARYGIPSLAKYSFLSNDVIWIGPSETVTGQMQSNNGIRFDGTTDAPVQSAKTTYSCPSSQGCSGSPTKNGVWGGASQAVQGFWQFPVPAVDFSTLTSNLATLKSNAQSGGTYLPPASGAQGYSLVFNSNGTMSVYKVTALASTPDGEDVNHVTHSENIDYSARTLQFTQALPPNGIIYIEDKVWIEGTVRGRAMVVAARLPYSAATAPEVYIPNNIRYVSKDGSDVLGILSQTDIVVTYNAPDDLEIDAAMIAQNGSAQFYYFAGGGTALKDTITVYGTIMTYGQWTWNWVSGSTNVSGYANTVSSYDANLLYAPPPGFPLSSAGYQQMSWKSN